MRDPKRIDRVLGKLGEAWHKNPQLRLGQLVVNLPRFNGDCRTELFFIEDDVLEGMIDNLIGPD